MNCPCKALICPALVLSDPSQLVTFPLHQEAAVGRRNVSPSLEGPTQDSGCNTPAHRQPLLGQAHPFDVSCWAWQLCCFPVDQPQCLAALELHSQSTSRDHPTIAKKKKKEQCRCTSCLCRNHDNLINCHLLLTPDLLGSPSEKHLVQSCLLL